VVKNILLIKVIPNSSKNAIEGFQGEVLKIRIQATPEKGKANKELIAFLAKEFRVPQSAIRILAGQTSRLKKIEITSESGIVIK
jgi:uncharacterized protein (TIGR00251 family)